MLLIDPTIRDWVLVPLLVLVAVVYYLRVAVMTLLSPAPSSNAVELAQRGLLGRSTRLRASGGFLSSRAFTMRKEFLSGEEGGKLTATASSEGAPANPMPSTDGMKANVAAMALQMGPVMWVSSVVTGFLLLKLPFPLAARFKSLTQQVGGRRSAQPARRPPGITRASPARHAPARHCRGS